MSADERHSQLPRLAFEALPDGRTDIAFGFAAGTETRHVPDSDERLLRQAAILARLADGLAGVDSGTRRLEVRLLRARPRGPVELAVLAGVSGGSGARRGAERYREELAVLLEDLAPGIVWRPITRMAALKRVLRPFPVVAAARLHAGVPGGAWGPVCPEALTETAVLTREPFVLSIALRPSPRPAPEGDDESHLAAYRGPGGIALIVPTGVPPSDPGVFGPGDDTLEVRIAVAAPCELSAPLLSAARAEVRGLGRWGIARRMSGAQPVADADWVAVPNTNRALAEASRALRTVDPSWPSRGEAGDADSSVVGLRAASWLFALPAVAPRGAEEHWPSRLLHVPKGVPRAGVRLGRSIGERPRPVALGAADLLRHVAITGVTGSGKSTAQENVAVQCLASPAAPAVFLFDAHAALSDRVLGLMPEHRRATTVVFDPSDLRRPVTFNPLECAETDWDYVVSSFIGMLYAIFDPRREGIIGPRFEHAVRNAFLTVLPTPGATLLDVMRVLMDPTAHKEFLPRVADPVVRSYWISQIANTSDFHRSEVLDYVVSKFGRFVTDQRVRAIVSHARSSVDIDGVIRDGGTVVFDLDKGKIGGETALFLGHLLIPAILAAAMRRGSDASSAAPLRPIVLVIDEFQNFVNPALVAILAEGRKYGISAVLANQHGGQLAASMREAILGNVGTIMAFRLGVVDAPLMTEALGGDSDLPRRLTTLPNFHAVARILADGHPQPPIVIRGEPPATGWSADLVRHIRESSRMRYGVEYEAGPRQLEGEWSTGSSREGDRRRDS